MTLNRKIFSLWLFATAIITVAIYVGNKRTEPVASSREAPPPRYSSDNLDYGIPIQSDILIERDGYAVGYSKGWKIPVWVSYRLTRQEIVSNVCARSDAFAKDPLIDDGYSTPSDYANSGYDKGHLAPAADMMWSTNAMRESFYMSNMAPQKPPFNRGIWSALETWVRDIARRETNIVVVTGPIVASNDTANTIGKHRVVVPSSFYKVILDETPPMKMIAFVLPNEKSKLPIEAFAVTVDMVEGMTGLDFFKGLPDEQEEALESFLDFAVW